jgi:hypothetical protein
VRPIDSSEIFSFEQFSLDRRGGGLFGADKQGAYFPIAIGSHALVVLRGHRSTWPLGTRIRVTFWPSVVVADSNLTIQILALHRILDQGPERKEVASKQSLSAATASWFR